MPIINVQPVKMRNGDTITSYTDTVGTVDQTFTFLTTQETVILTNKGTNDIIYTIGLQTGTVGRSESVKVTDSISSITLRSVQGTQAFNVWSDELGNNSESKVSSTNIKQIRDNASTFEYSFDGTTWRQVQGGSGGGGPTNAIFVTQSPYNAVGDGVTDDTVAIQAALDAAKLVNGIVVFPYGKTFMIADELVPYEGITLFGYGATLKHLPNRPNYTRILDATKTGKIYSGNVDSKLLIIKGLTFDGNLANQTYPVGHAQAGQPWTTLPDYSLEQNMLLVLGADPNTTDYSKKGRLRAIVEDCYFKDSVSDGIHVLRNADVKITNCYFKDCWRGGIVGSGGHSKIDVSNCTIGGDSYWRGVDIEIDSRGYGQSYRCDLIIDGLFCDASMDVGLQHGAVGNFNNITMTRPDFQYNGGANNGGSTGRFRNCTLLRDGTSVTSNGVYLPSNLTFDNCTIVTYKDPSNASTITHAGLNLYYNTTNEGSLTYSDQRTTFKGCRFVAMNKGASDTFYGVISTYTEPAINNNLTRFENCYASSDLTRMYNMSSGGNVEFHNIECDATVMANLNYTGSERFTFKASGYIRGKYTEYIRCGRSFDSADIIEHNGVYQDVTKSAITGTSGLSPTLATIIGNRIIMGAAAPGGATGGLVGDIYRLKTPVASSTYEWVATTNSKSASTWVVARTLGT